LFSNMQSTTAIVPATGDRRSPLVGVEASMRVAKSGWVRAGLQDCTGNAVEV